MTLPKDPYILLSVINTKLRDEYPSLAELCASEGIDEKELTDRLSAAAFAYLPSANQFR